jgi:hypothetical protein
MVDGGLGYLVATFTLRGKLANANFSLEDLKVQICRSRVHLMKSNSSLQIWSRAENRSRKLSTSDGRFK